MSQLIANVSCVSIDGRALLISGAPGSGKSSLALALIDRGATLVGDDGVVLDAREGRCVACPPPRISGRLEIRNVGIVEVACTEASLALAIRLETGAPRYVEAAGTVELAGCTVPEIALFPDTPALPLRAEWALRLHGLP